MKYIISFIIITWFFSIQMLPQNKSGYLNKDEDILKKFKTMLKETLAEYNETKISNLFNNNFNNEDFRALDDFQQMDLLFQNGLGSPQINNSLNKEALGKRFLESERTNQNWDGVAWANNAKYVNSYDAKDNKVQYYKQNWNVSVWDNSYRYSYVYDANDNQTEYTYQTWNGTIWVNVNKYLYTYDQNNNTTEQLTQTWNGTTWLNSSRRVSNYNSFNKTTQVTDQTWSGSAWTHNTTTIYTYDSNRNNTQTVYQNWNGASWVNSQQNSMTYNSNNKLTEQINTNWSGSAWTNSSKYSYSYDASNNQSENISQSWTGTAWRNSTKTSFTYNNHGDFTEAISQLWDTTGNAWKNSYKYAIQYSASFKMTEYLLQFWDVSVWKDYGKINYSYDTNDNNTQQITQLWNGTAWTNSAKTAYSYIPGHYVTYVNMHANFDFGDPTQTNSYQIIGLPCAINFPITDVLIGSPGKEGDWRAFWDPGTGDLKEYDGSDIFKFTPGKAFWIISKTSMSVNQNVNTVTIDPDNTYSIPLHSEWNLISNPLDKTISWNSIQNLNSITQPIHFFEDGSYSNPAGFEIFKGYYFFNATNLPRLKIPYNSAVVLPKQTVNNQNEFSISVYSNNEEKASISIGISDEAKEGVDMLDIFAPPSQFSDVSINIINDKLETNYKLLQKDNRPEIGEGQEFDFIVKNLSDKNVDMIFSGANNFGDNKIFLLDKTLWKIYDLSKMSSFEVRKNTEKKEFSILIGTEEFILQKKAEIMPTEFTLYQNYPNPFNPNTKIRFSVPVDEKLTKQNVSLKIFDILGNEITTLVNEQKEAGYYEVEFNASSLPVGRQGLASGIYIYNLKVGERIKSGKMNLLK